MSLDNQHELEIKYLQQHSPLMPRIFGPTILLRCSKPHWGRSLESLLKRCKLIGQRPLFTRPRPRYVLPSPRKISNTTRRTLQCTPANQQPKIIAGPILPSLLPTHSADLWITGHQSPVSLQEISGDELGGARGKVGAANEFSTALFICPRGPLACFRLESLLFTKL